MLLKCAAGSLAPLAVVAVLVCPALSADPDAWTLVDAPRVREPAYARTPAPLSHVSMIATAAAK